MATSKRDSFDLFALPPELRNLIYEFAFSPDIAGEVGILTLPNGPDHTLCLTSKLIYSESAAIYAQAVQDHRSAYQNLLKTTGTALVNEDYPAKKSFDIFANDTYSDAVGNKANREAVYYYTGLQLRGGYLEDCYEGSDKDSSDDFDGNAGQHLAIVCNHLCDCQAMCLCIHNFQEACYHCRNFYALAALFATRPEKLPRLLNSDGSLTRFGTDAWAWTFTMCGDTGERWMSVSCFGRDWWAYELERQRMVFERCLIRRKAMQYHVDVNGDAPIAHMQGGMNEEELLSVERDYHHKEVGHFDKYVEEVCFGDLKWEAEYARWIKEAGSGSAAVVPEKRWPSEGGEGRAFDSMLIGRWWRRIEVEESE